MKDLILGAMMGVAAFVVLCSHEHHVFHAAAVPCFLGHKGDIYPGCGNIIHRQPTIYDFSGCKEAE